MNRRVHVGVFDDKEAFISALRTCSGEGFKLIDCFTPHPMHEVEEAMKFRPTRLPWATFIGGALGLAGGVVMQYWMSAVDWPIDVGGKPWDSLPAFVPVIFEMTVLLAGLATVFGLLGRCGLWPGKRRRLKIEGVTDDRYALLVARDGESTEWRDVGRVLEEHGAVERWEEVS